LAEQRGGRIHVGAHAKSPSSLLTNGKLVT